MSLNQRLISAMEEIVEQQFGFRRGREAREAIGLLRITGERYR